MAKNRTLVVPKNEEIKKEAIKAVIEQLGTTKAAFFFRETMSQKMDYLKIKEKLFGKKTADDMYRAIKKECKGKRK